MGVQTGYYGVLPNGESILSSYRSNNENIEILIVG